MDGLLLKNNKDDGGGGLEFRTLEGTRWVSCVWVEIMAVKDTVFFENLSRSFFWPLMELQKWDPNTRPLSLVAVSRSWP
jgi:hypothetical protein